MAPRTDGRDGDWLASLARQAASADAPSKSGIATKRKRKGGGGKKNEGGDGTAPSSALTKAERIARREQKRMQREERKRIAEEARREKLARKRPRTERSAAATMQADEGLVTARASRQEKERKGRRKRGMTSSSKRALAHLSNALDAIVESTPAPPKAKRDKKQHQDASSPPESLTNGLPAEPSGKATKRGTLRPDSSELHPRPRDYNGQGLVRPSLYLPFDDLSYVPKLELEFAEHVPGFFGRARQKAAKKQANEEMLWKRCLKAKAEEEEEGEEGNGGRKKKKRKEGRVEGLLREGIV